MTGLIATVCIVAVVAIQAIAISRSRNLRASMPAADPVPVAVSSAGGPLAPIVNVLRRHRWVRRSLSGASVLAALVAVGLIGYPFYTNLVQSRIQSRLDRQLASPELLEAYRAGRIQEGDSLTRLKIPSIDVDVVVVEGTTSDSLRAGAGHYASTPLPCETGNVGIAGHRTTYGRPFNHLDLVKEGDLVILEIPIGTCTYKVTKKPFIVLPTDIWVIGASPNPMLTLTTCHPKGSARERLILQAELVESNVVTS
jgi:sortase A